MDYFWTMVLIIFVIILVVLITQLAAHSGVLGATGRYVLANNSSFCPVQDQLINKLVDDYKEGIITAELDKHVVTFSNGKEVWIANYPYACYHLRGVDARVSAKTFRKFRRFVSELACN